MPTVSSQKRQRQKKRTAATRRGHRKVLALDKSRKQSQNRNQSPKNNNKKVVKGKTAPQKKAAVTNKQKQLAKQTVVSTIRASSFSKSVSLTSLYRNVHANVQFILANLAPGALGPVASKPARTPGGLAFYLYWAFLDYVRVNGNPNDGVPGFNTLPAFGRHWNLPAAFIYFIQGYLRNRTKTIDINSEFGDLTALFSGTVGVGIPYSASHAQYTSAYGNLYPGINTANVEWQFPVSVSTATVAQIIAIGSELNDIVGKACQASLPFDTILSKDEDDGITGYNSPILCANPTSAGFASAYPFEAEMAYLCIDVSTTTAAAGSYFKAYPVSSPTTNATLGQDQFVIDAVNLINHMSMPLLDFRGKGGKRIPRSIYKVLNNVGHNWHTFGKLKTLVVCHTLDQTAWIGLTRLIGQVMNCVFGAMTNLAADGTLVNAKKVVEYCMQAYAFVHCLDWGWTHYTVPFGLDTSIYCNAITMSKLSGFKALNVPSVILDWVRNLAYPINQGGQLCLPSMPKVARSCLANWAGLQAAYSNSSDVLWASTAAPDGYGTFLDFTGLGTSQLYTAASITTPVPWSINARLSFNLTAANAFGTITATNQSPALPIRLTKMFLMTYDNLMMGTNSFTLGGYTYFPPNQALFGLSFPPKGGVGFHAVVNAVRQVLNNDNGWATIDWDICDAQIGVAVDTASFFRAIDAPRQWNVLADSDDVPEIYPFRVEMAGVENGLTELIDSMKLNNGGIQYQSILTGTEGNPRFTNMEYKNLIALDHVVDQIHQQRASPSFIRTNMWNAMRLYVLSQKDLRASYSELTYVGQGDDSMFAPRSITGFLGFLSGLSGIFHTGSMILGGIAKGLDTLLGTKTITAI